VSRILEKSPFDPELLNHTEPQLDFILEMYSAEHPAELKFTRPGKPDPELEKIQSQIGWVDVLTGKALDDYLKPRLPSEATLEKLRNTVDSSAVVRMGPRTN